MSNIINPGAPTPPQQQVNINLNDAQDLTCKHCGNHFFNTVYMFKKISALVSPSGRESIVPIETFSCIECGTVPPELLPKAHSHG
jgi:hypothetical protein